MVKPCLFFCLWQVMKCVSLSDLESCAPKNSKKAPRGANRRTIWQGKEERSLKNKLIPGSLSTNSYRLALCSITGYKPLDEVKCGPKPRLYFFFFESWSFALNYKWGEETNLQLIWGKRHWWGLGWSWIWLGSANGMGSFEQIYSYSQGEVFLSVN